MKKKPVIDILKEEGSYRLQTKKWSDEYGLSVSVTKKTKARNKSGGYVYKPIRTSWAPYYYHDHIKHRAKTEDKMPSHVKLKEGEFEMYKQRNIYYGREYIKYEPYDTYEQRMKWALGDALKLFNNLAQKEKMSSASVKTAKQILHELESV